MRKNFLIMLTAVAILLSAGCVYQANLSQGNLLKQEDLDQVEIGMTPNQVRFLLGTPMVDDSFHQDRWDYVYFIRIGRQSAAFKRWVTILFEEGVVSEVREDQDLSDDL